MQLDSQVRSLEVSPNDRLTVVRSCCCQMLLRVFGNLFWQKWSLELKSKLVLYVMAYFYEANIIQYMYYRRLCSEVLLATGVKLTQPRKKGDRTKAFQHSNLLFNKSSCNSPETDYLTMLTRYKKFLPLFCTCLKFLLGGYCQLKSTSRWQCFLIFVPILHGN